MSAAELFGPDWIPVWATGISFALLAIALFLLDVGNRAQRIFALVMALRGLTFFAAPLRFEATTVRESVLWATLAPYAIVPLVPLVVYFLCLYPERRWLAKTRWGPPFLLLASAGLTAWYFLDHASYATITATNPALYVEYGPLFLLTGLRLPLLVGAGLVLARDYLKDPKGSRGFSLFLLVAAFTLNGLFDGVAAVLDLTAALSDPATSWWPWTWTRWWLPVLALPLALATCLSLFPVLALARQDRELQEITRFLFIAVPLALVTPLVRLLPHAGAEDNVTFLMGVWRLLIPFLLAYALLRYQLFDIDIRLKAGVRRAIIVGAFTVTFFLVSEAAESLVQGNRGPLFGIASAGFLALAARPVQGFAGRISDRFMPDTKPIAEQSYDERLRFYLEQYRLIQQDGLVTPKERAMLMRLQVTLALPDDAVYDLETMGRVEGAKAASKSKASHPNAPAAPKDSRLELVIRGTLVAGTMALFFGMLSQGLEVVLPLPNVLAGFLSAALVAVLLGPLETLADRLTHRLDPKAATEAKDEKERRAAFTAALTTALEDGSLSERDLVYLASLQERLRISGTTRWRLERQAKAPLRRQRTRRTANS